MREFETLRAYIAPVIVVPGTTTVGGTLGDQAPDHIYTIERDGWYLKVTDPGPFTGAPGTQPGGPYYNMFGYHRSQIEWTPWARSDIAMTPLGQDVVEGKNFAAFHTPYPETTFASGVVFPAWSGSFLTCVDIWSSEEIEEDMIENLAWNSDLPGAEASYPAPPFSSAYYPKNNPDLINHKLRFDQVISARYRQFISSTNAPSAQYFGGQLVSIHDQVVGGNASMSDTIHHIRYVYFVSSNNGLNNIDDPAGAGVMDDYNHLKMGFFIPSAIDTLTVGLNKVESDAEWATLARRGASR